MPAPSRVEFVPASPRPRWNRFAAAAASFVAFAGFTLVMPFLPLYFRELGVTDVSDIALWSGMSLGVTPAMTALLAPVWGRLADRFGLKIMVERSLLSFVLIMGATAYVTEPWQVLALRTLQGFFAGFGALTLAMATESAPRDEMAASIGSVQIAQRLGPAIGPVIGGLLAQVVGLRRSFLVTAAFYAVAFLLVLLLYRDEPSTGSERNDTGEIPLTTRAVLRLPNVLLLMASIFLLQFSDRAFGPILPLFISHLGTPLGRVPLVAGIVYSIAAGTGAIGHAQCSHLLARASARTVILVSTLCAGVAMAAIGTAPGVNVLMAGTAVFGMATGVAMTAIYAVAGSAFPPRARGIGFGVLTTASLSGIALSPVLSGVLGAVNLRAVFLVSGAAMGALAWGVARRMRMASGGTA